MFSPARLSIRSAICVSLICALCAIGLGCSARGPVRSAAERSDSPAPRLRVLTWNIHHGEGVDALVDLERIARVISDQRPDLVALQEVDRKTRRSGGVDQAAELARLTGMNVSFGKAIDYQGGDYGQAVLSRFPIQAFRIHRLPGQPESEQRIAVEAVVQLKMDGPPNSTVVRFIGTHLHHLPEESNRLRQAAELNRLFAGEDDGTPTILAGDFNAEPASETMSVLRSRWQDAGAYTHDLGPRQLTYPANEPRKRIDYVLLRPLGWRVIDTRVVPETVASDHSPVLAVVEWAPSSPYYGGIVAKWNSRKTLSPAS